MASAELIVSPEKEMQRVRAEDFLPLLTVDQAVHRKNQINEFIGKVLNEAKDYGTIPGSSKRCLLKPGAEKLCSIFGLAPRYETVEVIEDWTGEKHGGEPLFYYEYRCLLSRGDRTAGEGIGSCNSWESKYRYRWVTEGNLPPGTDVRKLASRESRVIEFDFAIKKAETGGQYGKPAEYWKRWQDAIDDGTATETQKETRSGKVMAAWEMGGVQYRIPNDQFADVINTCQKMAQKRALVAAVLVVTNCSDSFTQDVEDFEDKSEAKPAPKPAPPPDPNKPWSTFGQMVQAFEALKARLEPYTTPYAQALEKYGVKEPKDFKPSTDRQGLTKEAAQQKAADCYRALLAIVQDYEEAKKMQAAQPDDQMAFPPEAEVSV
jgi:hypothetical protein